MLDPASPVTAPKLPGGKRPLVALFTGACLIALAPIFVRLSETGPTATGFWRLALATPLLFVWNFRQARNRTAPVRPDLILFLVAGAMFAGDLAAWHVSIEMTSVANATLLANAAPIFVAAGAWIWFRDKPSAGFIAGLLLAIVGGALLARASATPGQLLGDGLGLLTAVFYAGYMLAVKVLRGRLSATTVMAWSSLFGAMVLLPLALVFGDQMLPKTTYGWAVLGGLALFSQVMGQGLIAWAIGHLSARFSALGLLTQTAAAALLAWVLFGEAFTVLQSIGIALVAAGLIVARIADDK
jgi:drug/metabolite transporter (DMT)-like permease